MEARKLVDFPGGLELHIGVRECVAHSSLIEWHVGLWTTTSGHAMSDLWPWC